MTWVLVAIGTLTALVALSFRRRWQDERWRSLRREAELTNALTEAVVCLAARGGDAKTIAWLRYVMAQTDNETEAP